MRHQRLQTWLHESKIIFIKKRKKGNRKQKKERLKEEETWVSCRHAHLKVTVNKWHWRPEKFPGTRIMPFTIQRSILRLDCWTHSNSLLSMETSLSEYMGYFVALSSSISLSFSWYSSLILLEEWLFLHPGLVGLGRLSIKVPALPPDQEWPIRCSPWNLTLIDKWQKT